MPVTLKCDLNLECRELRETFEVKLKVKFKENRERERTRRCYGLPG